MDPLIQYVESQYRDAHLGLIATRQTVNSNIYHQKISDLNKGIKLTSLATNLLASAIEEFKNNQVIDSLLDEYLSLLKQQGLHALILACTHYPVIKQKIAEYFTHKIDIIDPSEIVAKAVKETLSQHQLLNINGTGNKHFYVSDITESFVAGTKIFFEEALQLEHYPLWD